MSYQEEHLKRLQERMNQLSLKQVYLGKELEDLQKEMNAFSSILSQAKNPVMPIPEKPATTTDPVFTPSSEASKAQEPVKVIPPQQPVQPAQQQPYIPIPPAPKRNWEKFLGENLINKIGIAITIIGVGVGAKYAIDHQLISPLMRIILGYVLAGSLLGIAMKLKANYHSYSAVLLSGALAMMYFLTFFAYNNYGLIPQLAAFLIMVVFTAFLVFAATQYNEQLIALIGILGAYLVPILLSDGSGKVMILFSYMTIINAGVLYLAYKRNWLQLLYASYVLTWLIFLGWMIPKYNAQFHLPIALFFSSLFFLMFYIALLANRISERKIFGPVEIIILLTNALIHFMVGYFALNHKGTDHLLGLFTVITAAVHFVMSIIIHKKDVADKQLYYLVSGLVLVFITLAIPVQLKGNWITVMWATEALLIYWIGRSKSSPVYEGLAYPVMFLAIISQITDWANDHYDVLIKQGGPFLNPDFATGTMVVVSFGLMMRVAKKTTSNFKGGDQGPKNLIPVVFTTLLYFLLYGEIHLCFYPGLTDLSKIQNHGWIDYQAFMNVQNLTLILYTVAFLASLSLYQYRMGNSAKKGVALYILNILGSVLFLGLGLYLLSELREHYLATPGVSILYLLARYPALLLFTVFLYVDRLNSQKSGLTTKFGAFTELRLHFVIVWVLSSELLQWLDIAGVANSYKLGLSLLWGTYSLGLIALGIRKRKKIIRIVAFILFGFTLLKLFIYDLARLSAISKTVVLVALGLLLLIISFLYNKYKHQISDEE